MMSELDMLRICPEPIGAKQWAAMIDMKRGAETYKAINDLRDKIANLRAENTELRRQVAELIGRLAALEAK